MKKISYLLVCISILTCLLFVGCNSHQVDKYVSNGKFDLKDMLTDSSVNTISVYLGNYTHIAEINDEEGIQQICDMLLNDIPIEQDKAKISEFKYQANSNYGVSFLSIYFNDSFENKILVRIYDDSHIYISAFGKEFISYSACFSDLDKMYTSVLSNRIVPKEDTTDLNILFSLITETVSSISVYSNLEEFICCVDKDKIALLPQEIMMLYVPKYDFSYSSEGMFCSYEYLKCERQIANSKLFIVQYQNGAESRFYLGTDNKIYYIDETGNVFVSEKEYALKEIIE